MNDMDRRRVGIVGVLGALIAIGPLTIDLYLPALPAIRADLATSAAGVQLTITATMVGMAVGNLLVGPLSDLLGRRRPLLVGLLVHVVASVLCALATDVTVLAALRVLQGVAVAAAGVIATAVLRDLCSGAVFARLLSRLLVIPTAAPIVAPSIGGVVLRWTQWRGVFVVLAVAVVVLIAVVVVALPETLPPDRRRPARLASTTDAFRTLTRDRTFVGFAVVAGLSMAALLAYVAGSSFVFQEEYGLSEQQFGVVFGAGAIGLVAATQLNVRLLRQFTPERILAGAMLAGAASAVVLVVCAVTGLGGVPGVLVPLWLTIATVGLAFPNTPALAMSRHGAIAGTAAALLGAAQFGLGGAAAPLVGLFGTGSVGMATVVAAAMIPAAVVATVLCGRVNSVDAEPAAVAGSVRV
jgi:DHA1 family bicyclomycin/chloramphenicol resistance-like MFS transporter